MAYRLFLFSHNFMLNVSFTYSKIKIILTNTQDDQGKSGNFEMENLWEPHVCPLFHKFFLEKYGTYAYLVITVVYFCNISYMNSWMLLIFSIVIIYHQSLMHIRSKFTPCQHQVNWAICAVLNSLLLEISTDLKSCGEYALIKAC